MVPTRTFDLDYPDDQWTCPVTGAGPVPKLVETNLEYRSRLIDKATDDTGLQQSLINVCAKSPLFFFNTFGWCYRPKQICGDGFERSAGANWTDRQGVSRTVPPADQPVVTWPAQDAFIEGLLDSVRQGGMVLVPKSREQGATLLLMLMCCWGLLFWRRFSALCISRREDLVENLTEDSLMGKVHYAVSKLPPWMLPGKIDRTLKPIKTVLPAMGSMILGESANVDVGQSHRVMLTVVDEASRFPYGGATLLKSIASVGACTVLASTPNGPGTAFSKLCLKQIKEPSERVKLLELSYADSPTHGRGREWVLDEDGAITGTKGGGYWETPAFKLAREQTASPKDWRENWLISHDTSGLLVLNAGALANLRRGVRVPRRGMLVDGRFEELDRGKLHVWEDPHPHTNYVIGGDFAQGVEKSNTVLAVMDRGTGCIVAEYVDPSIDAYEAVPIAMELGTHYGGEWGHSLVIWENNGPGVAFGRDIVRKHYPHLYYQRAETSYTDAESKSYGWTSTPQRKEIAFSDLNKALASGVFTTWSAAGIDDLSMWLYDDHGRIVSGATRDETSGAAARHGDRAIAYALCVKGRDYTYPYSREPETGSTPGTFAAVLGHDQVWAEAEDFGKWWDADEIVSREDFLTGRIRNNW